jgi:mannose-1-phosphate guanylyltransferase
MSEVFPVILAGGKGERFWPYSTKNHPKQMLPLVTKQSMLEDILEHLNTFSPESLIHIIVSDYLVAPLKKVLKGKNNIRLIGEPLGRNTAPAIALAARLIAQKNPKGIMLVMTADHAIRPRPLFHKALKAAVKNAASGEALVTFGILPDRPETGYGYVQLGAMLPSMGSLRCFEVKGFSEKPDLKTAQKYFQSKKYLWNSGMFAWRVDFLWSELKRCQPRITELFESAGKLPAGARALNNKLQTLYSALPSVSIDYGLMEKASAIRCVEAVFKWDDVGSWSALERLHKADKDGNIFLANTVADNCSGCITFSDGALVAIKGLKDMLVVHLEGVTMMVPKSDIAGLKELVAKVRDQTGEAFL